MGRSWLRGAVVVAAVAVAGCQGTATQSEPATTPGISSAAVSASTAPTAARTVTVTTAASPASTPAPTSTAASSKHVTSPARAPQTLSLATGQTAHLTYFDVTLLRSTPGKDGISHGWKVRVCYTSPHPEQNADGTTRVSTNPWSVLVRDGEGGQEGRWTRIDEFPADKGWQPPYPSRLIRVGQCAEGWLAIRHDNPDLQFPALRYAPADFGDQVTWTTS